MPNAPGPEGPVSGSSSRRVSVTTWLRLEQHPVTGTLRWVSAPTEIRSWGNPSIGAWSGFTRCLAVDVGDTLLWENPSGEASTFRPSRVPLRCDPDRRSSQCLQNVGFFGPHQVPIWENCIFSSTCKRGAKQTTNLNLRSI